MAANKNASIEQLRSLDSPIFINVADEVKTPFLHVLWAPYDVMNQDFKKDEGVGDLKDVLMGTKDKDIVIFCRSGRRAGMAISKLQDYGFTRLYNGVNLAHVLEARQNFSNGVDVRQLFDRDSCTYTYIVKDRRSGEALIIDPVLELVERDIAVIDAMQAKLKFILNTHVHADHITSSSKLRSHFAVLGQKVLTAVSAASGAVADIKAGSNSVFNIGSRYVFTRPTPGHTLGCVSYVLDDLSCVFTGDALLIGGCGRTDFQSGDPALLYKSVWKQVLSLPSTCVVWPAHDYAGRTSSTVAEERRCNPRFTKSVDDFVKLMNKRFDGKNLPQKMLTAVPANMVCGVFGDDGNPIPHPGGWTMAPNDKESS